jgi:hypothetical protein
VLAANTVPLAFNVNPVATVTRSMLPDLSVPVTTGLPFNLSFAVNAGSDSWQSIYRSSVVSVMVSDYC